MIPPGPWSFDLSFAHAVQSSQPAWLTVIAKTISLTGQPEVIVPIMIVIAIWLVVQRRPWQEWALLAILAGNGLTLVLKHFVGRPRPTSALVNVLVHEANSSFPSGHALASILTAGAIWVIFRTRRPAWLHVLLVVYVLAIGWSRIYLGVHWLSDVMAGYAIGALWLFGTFIILRPTKNRPITRSA